MNDLLLFYLFSEIIKFIMHVVLYSLYGMSMFDERTQIFELLVQGIHVLCISKVAHVPQCNEHTTIFLY